MEPQNTRTRMQRFSVQVPEALLAGLQDLARRERQDLQTMLRNLLQAVVDGDDPGRVVSAGTREAIDALRDEQRRGEAALAQVVKEGIEFLQQELARGREADEGERADLRAALRELQEGVAGLQAGVDRALETQPHPAHDESRRGLRGRFRGGGG